MSVEEASQSLADEYPEFVVTDKDGNKRFDIAALMRSKGYIK